ncbi:MAG: hypothetical protein GX591_10015 [Planctomycetes bacterium]|nr:hypothetical protein [Planctomycetota bacterium]
MIPLHAWHMTAGWGGMVFGALLGMVFGLWAESRQWAGGYGSFRRQMLRLAHVAAFALGIINVLYAFSAQSLAALPSWAVAAGSGGMIAGGLLMPLVCLATAWRRAARHLLAIPAACVAVALIVQAWGWGALLASGG